MVSLVIALVLGQTAAAPAPEGVAVVVSRREGMAAIEAWRIADQLADQLREAGVKRILRASVLAAGPEGAAITACRTRAPCLAAVGQRLGTWAVVELQEAKVVDDLALVLDLLESETGKRLRQQQVVLPADSPEWKVRLRELATAVAQQHPSQPAPPPLQIDRPVADPVKPPGPPLAKPAPNSLAVAARPSPLRPATYIAGGAAVATAALALGFAVYGQGQQSTYDHSLQPDNTSTLTYEQAQAAVNNANGAYTGALISGVASAALTGGALYLLFNGQPAQR